MNLSENSFWGTPRGTRKPWIQTASAGQKWTPEKQKALISQGFLRISRLFWTLAD
jgi:hypothetical protein